MGIFASRSGVVTEDVTDQSSNINPLMYRYPPKQGNYFSNYFIMGGERFDVQQPEAYLFGDNSDLNFLGNRPVPVCLTSHFYYTCSDVLSFNFCFFSVSIFSTTNQ
jgi:hypothetical protein